MSNNIKKILIVCPSFNVGGIERTLSNLANYFASKNIEVIFVSCLSGRIFFELDSKIKIVSPSFSRNGNIFKLIFYRLRLINYIRKNCIEFKPDIVLSMSDTFNPIVLIAALNLSPKVFIGDVTRPDRKFAWSTRVGKRLFYPFASGFIAQTKWAENFYRTKFKNNLNIRVINGAVKDVNVYDVPKQNLIINVGRLSIEKGQDRMLEIFALLKNRNSWKLGLTADGPLRKKLEEMVIEMGLKDNVLFLGKVEDLDLLYSQASIFALPSRIEGFPNALCEAMAAGLPSVSFNSFPVEEIIQNNVDGFIVQDGDLLAFADIIDKLIEDVELREQIGLNAMKITDRLNIEKIGNQFLTFFDS
jgi:GalNAc-alpha-(1->4)-GalNAc-alpha-(1->3)-diNAcBac-PP-undecaprenol alpha-1,4-N-acetyl-D-galactosaminyltransferase